MHPWNAIRFAGVVVVVVVGVVIRTGALYLRARTPLIPLALRAHETRARRRFSEG